MSIQSAQALPASRKRQILITGGAGFVGSHLADGLLRQGHAVRVLDDLHPQVHPGGERPAYLSTDVEMIHGDVRDPNLLKFVLQGVDVVYHFAATVGVGQSMYEISRYMSVNTQGTAELLQAVLDSKLPIEKIVVASSMSIYGEGRYVGPKDGRTYTPPVRTTEQLKRGEWEVSVGDSGPLQPVPTDESKPSEINSMYALSKRDQEELCMIYGRTYGLPVTALRFFNIYGTRQALSNPYTGVAAVFASRMLNGKQPLIFEDGEQQRDFVSIHDIVRANILAMDAAASNGEVINIGSGQPVSIRRIAELLAGALGSKGLEPVVTGKYRAGDIRHCFADISKARKLLGYEPQVSHEEGFAELADWLQSQQAEDKADTMLQQLAAHGLTA